MVLTMRAILVTTSEPAILKIRTNLKNATSNSHRGNISKVLGRCDLGMCALKGLRSLEGDPAAASSMQAQLLLLYVAMTCGEVVVCSFKTKYSLCAVADILYCKASQKSFKLLYIVLQFQLVDSKNTFRITP